MVAFKRILLATDFADSSAAAREFAAGLAGCYDADLHVLYVQVLLAETYGWSGYAGLAEADRALEEFVATRYNAEGEGGTKVVEVARRGVAAAPEIVAYAADNDVDLIVTGTHRRKGVERWFMGSVSSEVVRSAKVPVLVVGPEDAYLGQTGGIVAAVDFSDSSIEALKAAADIAKEASVELVALHVVEPLKLPPYYTSTFEEAERADAHQAMVERVAALDLPVEVDIVVATGPAHEQINETAREHGAGLVVVGTRGLSGLESVLVGSVADRVIRGAPCPVLAHR